MSLRDKQQTLTIKMRVSLQKVLLIVVPHLIVIIMIVYCVAALGINAAYLVSLFLIAISLIYFIRLHLQLDLKKSIHSLHIDKNDNWNINTAVANNNEQVIISGKSFACGLFIILCLIDNTKNQFTVLITKDSVTQEQYRKIRVFINTHQLSN